VKLAELLASADDMLLNAQLIAKEQQKVVPLALEILEYFKCEGCASCCKIPVGLTNSDITRLYKLEGDTFFDKLEDRVVPNYLKSPCPYLEDNNCKVYNDRPLLCRLYPFSMAYVFPSIRLCPLGMKILEEYKKIVPVHATRKKKIDKAKGRRSEEKSLALLQDITDTSEEILDTIFLERDKIRVPVAALSIEKMERLLRYLRHNTKKV